MYHRDPPEAACATAWIALTIGFFGRKRLLSYDACLDAVKLTGCGRNLQAEPQVLESQTLLVQRGFNQFDQQEVGKHKEGNLTAAKGYGRLGWRNNDRAVGA
jgi:hypothetical protein